MTSRRAGALAEMCGATKHKPVKLSVIRPTALDIESLTKSADSAMYRAKQAGKNAYRFFSGAMDSRNRVGMR